MEFETVTPNISAYPPRSTYPDQVGGHDRQPPHQRDGGSAAPIIINPPSINTSEVLEALRALPQQMAQAVNKPVISEDPRAAARSIMVQEQLTRVIADQQTLVNNFSRLSNVVSQQQHKAEVDERMRQSSEQVQQLTRMVEALAAKSSSSQPSEALVHELKKKDQEIKRLSSIIEHAAQHQVKAPREAPKSLDLVGQELALVTAAPQQQAFFPSSIRCSHSESQSL